MSKWLSIPSTIWSKEDTVLSHTHWVVCVKYIQLSICQSYLNKVDRGNTTLKKMKHVGIFLKLELLLTYFSLIGPEWKWSFVTHWMLLDPKALANVFHSISKWKIIFHFHFSQLWYNKIRLACAQLGGWQWREKLWSDLVTPSLHVFCGLGKTVLNIHFKSVLILIWFEDYTVNMIPQVKRES